MKLFVLSYFIIAVNAFIPSPTQGYHQLLEVLIDSDSNTIEKNYDKYNIEFLNVLKDRLQQKNPIQLKQNWKMYIPP